MTTRQVRHRRALLGFATLSAVVGAMLAGPAPAFAEYPTKPVTVVVPYAPGGSSDLAARTLANAASKYMPEPVVVANRAGAGGITGTAAVYNGASDGYTLLLARVATFAVAPAVNSKLPYDFKAFTYLGQLETNPYACATATAKPYEKLDDLLQAVRKKPGTVTYSSSGIGSLTHLATVMLLDAAGIENPKTAAIHVPTTGEGPAAATAVGGQVDFVCGNLAPMLGAIEADQLRPLLVMASAREPSLPDTPTATEAGYSKLDQVFGWSALVGPPDMDPKATAAWVGVLAKIAKDEEWRDTTRRMGSVPHITPPVEIETFAAEQHQLFVDVVDRLGLKVR